MAEVGRTGGGRGDTCSADFLDCTGAELARANVRALTGEPRDICSFAETVGAFAKICEYPEGHPHRWGYYMSRAGSEARQPLLPAVPVVIDEGGPPESNAGLAAGIATAVAVVVAAGAYVAHRIFKGRGSAPMPAAADISSLGLADVDPLAAAEGSQRPPFRARPPSRPQGAPYVPSSDGNSTTTMYQRPGDEGSSSDSVTTHWDGASPDDGYAGPLLGDDDIDFDFGPDSFGPDDLDDTQHPDSDKATAAPPREEPWQPLAERDASLVEVRACLDLVADMTLIPLYEGLPTEDIERRAQYHYEQWISLPDGRRADLLKGVDLENPDLDIVLRAGGRLIPKAWVLSQEAIVNAKLRLQKLAYRMTRLIEFSKLGKRRLEMRARMYLRRWLGMDENMRTMWVHEGMREGGEIEKHDDPSNFWPRDRNYKFAVSADEPPDSWLRWQDREHRAWEHAGSATSGSDNLEVRAVHRQLYNSRNPGFVELPPPERYRICEFVAHAMDEAMKDQEFMRRFVDEKGYISPKGVDAILRMSNIADTHRGFEIDRVSGLRFREERPREMRERESWFRIR